MPGLRSAPSAHPRAPVVAAWQRDCTVSTTGKSARRYSTATRRSPATAAGCDGRGSQAAGSAGLPGKARPVPLALPTSRARLASRAVHDVFGPSALSPGLAPTECRVRIGANGA